MERNFLDFMGIFVFFFLFFLTVPVLSSAPHQLGEVFVTQGHRRDKEGK